MRPTWPARKIALSVRSRSGPFPHELIGKGALLFSFQRPGSFCGQTGMYTKARRGLSSSRQSSAALTTPAGSTTWTSARRRRPTATRRCRRPVGSENRRPTGSPSTRTAPCETSRRASRGGGGEADVLQELTYPHVGGRADHRDAVPGRSPTAAGSDRRRTARPRRPAPGPWNRATSSWARSFLASIGWSSPAPTAARASASSRLRSS